VVFHLQDVKEGAKLTIDPAKPPDGAAKIDINLADILAGKPQTIWDGKAVVRLVSTASPVATDDTEDDFPAACYAPDGTLWVAYISYTLKKPGRRIETANLKQEPESFKDLNQPGFGDQLFVKSFKAGKWSEPIAITGPKEDLVRCAIAADPKGDIIVAYSAQREGNFDIYARTIKEGKLGAENRRTKQAGPELGPVLTSVETGEIWLGFQQWHEEKGFATVTSHHFVNGAWNEAKPRAEPAVNDWYGTVAAGPNNKVTVITERYHGDYDLDIQELEAYVEGGQAGHRGKNKAEIASSAFEARPSACYDPQGRLWIAYEEGPVRWGKDFGAFETSGNPLYFARAV
jgi:hypothetical protein